MRQLAEQHREERRGVPGAQAGRIGVEQVAACEHEDAGHDTGHHRPHLNMGKV